jgi:hypothetical protein
MATFPRTEPEVVVLAQDMVKGLTDNPTVFPTPVVTPANMTTLLSALTAAQTAATAAAAAAESATMAKTTALENLVAAMKQDIRYAENITNYEDDKLKLIGWGAHRAPSALTPPGQTMELHIAKQGEGWLQLVWAAPATGGAVSAYKVMRRERPAGPWEDVFTAVIPEANLVDQPRGKELEFRIIAVNKAGEGEPSNTEMVVL